jgi:hypothetical protein
MARQSKTYDEIMDLARIYGVECNALFVSAAETYATQKDIIDMIQKTLDETPVMVTQKTFKDRDETTVNPLIKELPKHADSANKTLSVMLDIIQKLGTKEPAGDKLSDFLAG